ncbi:MAG: hypothetical protein DMD87_10400 [Candidatus Rokuibacteriota bacterium]|nr:MAG: hypothetical protein DMD87_10400 [Candidatus Rokubacteria bacterium]
MLTSRDRRRFERAAARARRPSGRRSLATLAGRLALWAVVVGIALAGLVVGARGFYAYRSAEAPQTPEVALGGKPAAAPEPAREAETPRPADNRQARATEVRQAHLRQLQPVLRTDAERLSQVARRMRAEGRVTDVRRDRSDNAAELRALFTSHRSLSGDLPNHYQEYSQAKERLRRSVAEQDEEFQQTASLVMTRLSLPPAAEPRRPEITWAVLEKCLDKGPGMTLTTRPDGYQYTVRGRTQRYSGGATVAEDEGAAFAAFTSFAPDADVVAHCDSLKRRAAAIVTTADKLSADALGLAEQTTLPGECKYTKPD